MAGSTNAKQEWLERVLGYRLNQTPNVARRGGKAAAVRLAQAMLQWNQTRSHIGQQVAALQQAILSQARGEPDFEQIAAGVGKLEAVLELLDDRLTEQLNALRAATDPSQKQAISAAARRLVEEYRANIAGNVLINEIDDNGFIPLDIKPRVAATLAAVLETI